MITKKRCGDGFLLPGLPSPRRHVRTSRQSWHVPCSVLYSVQDHSVSQALWRSVTPACVCVLAQYCTSAQLNNTSSRDTVLSHSGHGCNSLSVWRLKHWRSVCTVCCGGYLQQVFRGHCCSRLWILYVHVTVLVFAEYISQFLSCLVLSSPFNRNS